MLSSCWTKFAGPGSRVADICVDASLVLSWLFVEEHSDRAYEARDTWMRQADRLIAPPMLTFEAPSVIRQAVYNRRMTQEEGDETLQAFLDLTIDILHPAPLVYEAWSVARTLNAPRLYDMYYVALAGITGCELWTADRRLANLAGSRFPFTRWIGDSLP